MDECEAAHDIKTKAKKASERRGMRNIGEYRREKFPGGLLMAELRGWMGSRLSLLEAFDISQLLGKEKLPGLARVSCLPVRKYTLMDTPTKMACHRKWLPKGKHRHVDGRVLDRQRQ